MLCASDLAEPLRAGCNLARGGADALLLHKSSNGAAGRNAIDVHAIERGIELCRCLVRLLPLELEGTEPRLGTLEFTNRGTAGFLQLDPTLELRNQAVQGIDLSVIRAAPIPPSAPAASARRMTLVCIHCARSACRFNLST